MIPRHIEDAVPGFERAQRRHFVAQLLHEPINHVAGNRDDVRLHGPQGLPQHGQRAGRWRAGADGQADALTACGYQVHVGSRRLTDGANLVIPGHADDLVLLNVDGRLDVNLPVSFPTEGEPQGSIHLTVGDLGHIATTTSLDESSLPDFAAAVANLDLSDMIGLVVEEDFKARPLADQKAIVVEVPMKTPPAINTDYPTTLPLATVPPSLLLKLPTLPEDPEYRFLGRHLILRDIKANLIVDFIPDVVPAAAAAGGGREARP